jgi:hypothetical protein
VAKPSFAVAEVQGLYGPFSFTEKLLQKIWLRGDFNRSAARLDDGRALRVIHPGKWNLLGGPDFKNARLMFDQGAELTGDVELHLKAGDWAAHGHAQDPAYNGVILHVVLFSPTKGTATRGAAGERIPSLALLPLLPHDLEEFAADEAIEVLSGHALANAPEELAALAPATLESALRDQAEKRWRQKVHYARLRLERLGWEAACHHVALEILGYRFNRAPMLRIAGRWPLTAWSSEAFDADACFESERAAWSVQGVRPANHPRTRLRQYARWTRSVPNWPERWRELAGELPQIDESAKSTREIRRRDLFAATRAEIAERVCGGTIGGTRLDNFICDGLLPLCAATKTEAGAQFDFERWFHWFPGDQPPVLARVLRQLEVCNGRGQPACHGFAQGLFGWLIEREARR